MDKKLLKWGLSNADPEALSNTKPQPLDPELINYILGHSETDEVKRVVGEVIANPEASEADLKGALEALEHFLQNLDLAGNMERMGLWPPVLKLLDHADVEVRRMTWWVIGTAAQNHPPVQTCLFQRHGIIFKLIDQLGELKAIRAMSAILQNQPEAIQLFTQLRGWNILDDLIASTPDPAYRERVAFVLQAISHEHSLPLAECDNLKQLFN